MKIESREELDQTSESVEQLARLVISYLEEFEEVWECANRVCDRYFATSAA